MRFKIDTSTATEKELLATAAFFNVLSGAADAPRQRLDTINKTLMTLNDIEISGDVARFVSAVRAEPGPVAQPIVGEALSTACDKNGLPWDERIHSSSKALNADGSWRIRRNLDQAVLDAVTAELKGQPVNENIGADLEETVNDSMRETFDAEEVEAGAPKSDDAPVVEREPTGQGESTTASAEVGDVQVADYVREPVVINDGPGEFMMAADPKAYIPQPNADVAQDTAPSIDGENTQASAETTGNGQTATSDASPSDEAPAKPTILQYFWKNVGEAKTWIAIKKHLSVLTNMDEFKGYPIDKQNAIKADVWIEAQNNGIDVDHVADPTAFICWSLNQKDGDVVDANFHVLQRDPSFAGMTPEQKDAMRKKVAELVTDLRGS